MPAKHDVFFPAGLSEVGAHGTNMLFHLQEL
jgi:hypothetical protein